MAREKMNLALPRINNEMLGIQLGGSDSLPRKFHKQKHSKSFTEIHSLPSLAWRNPDDRCSVLTFLTYESTGHWRIVSVPVHYPESECLGSGSQVRMDCLHLVPQPINSAQVERKHMGKGVATVTNGNILGSPVKLQNQMKTKWKELSKQFHHNSFPSSDSSSPGAKSSSEIKQSTSLINDLKIDHSALKSSKKKSKKKAKKWKKSLCQSGSTEQVVSLLKDHPHVGSISGACDDNIVDNKEIPRECMSQSKELELLEQAKPPVGKLPHYAQVNYLPPNSNFSKFCHSPNADFSEPPQASSFRKGFSGCKNLSSNTLDSCGNVDVASHGHQGRNGNNRRNIQNKTFPNFYSYRTVGCSPIGRENSHAVWKKVQRNSTSDSIAGDSNKDMVSSEWRTKINSAKVTASLAEMSCSESRPPSPCSTIFDLKSQATGDQPKAMQVQHDSGSRTQKWIPIALKDLGVINPDGSVLVERSSESTIECKGNLDSRIVVPETLHSADWDASMRKRQKNELSSAHRSDTELRFSNGLEPGLDRIEEAVKEACKLQLASEAVETLSGCPLAEFERLLRNSSPVLYHPALSICGACSRDQFGGVTLCRHEKPNVCLGSVWKWYEELGACGLEVNGDDCESAKRFGTDLFPFSAYFVPYLSAVQLFRNCDNHSSSEFSDSSETSSVSGAKDSSSHESVVPAVSSTTELLFEYFESEPPQQRRPLYEKIQQLLSGDEVSPNQSQGNPTNLENVKLNDLDHKSWYSVAWYPIYRIPEGHFRASFLTFHSLGHLLRRSYRFDSNGVQDCIVCPVVGLQSYNAQSECWFNPRSSTGINQSGVLKERLRTLEETASRMARGVVKKGSLTLANHHPDYEFFCSRSKTNRHS